MINYTKFDSSALAQDASFRAWILYQKPEATQFWEDWLRQNPYKTEDVREAREMVLLVKKSFDNISDSEIKNEMSRLSATLFQNEEEEIVETPVYRLNSKILWRSVAAVLLMAIGMGWYWKQSADKELSSPFHYEKIVQTSKIILKESINQSQKTEIVNLEDGSSVVLYPNSKLSYPEHFNQEDRTVYLTGEGFFEIAKDHKKPFYVYANGMVTKVLGTSFSIRAYEKEDDFRVVVKTGRVSIYKQNDPKQEAKTPQLTGLVLTANQQARFDQLTKHFERTLTEAPVLLSASVYHQSFEFKQTPIVKVFQQIEQAYGIQIVYNEETLKDCYLTASLDDEPLFEKLRLICQTINAKFERVEAQIVISSKGCE